MWWANRVCTDQCLLSRGNRSPNGGGKRCSPREQISPRVTGLPLTETHLFFPPALERSVALRANLPLSLPTTASFMPVLTASTGFCRFHLLNARFLAPNQILAPLPWSPPSPGGASLFRTFHTNIRHFYSNDCVLSSMGRDQDPPRDEGAPDLPQNAISDRRLDGFSRRL